MVSKVVCQAAGCSQNAVERRLFSVSTRHSGCILVEESGSIILHWPLRLASEQLKIASFLCAFSRAWSMFLSGACRKEGNASVWLLR